jgi:hypothetical protein
LCSHANEVSVDRKHVITDRQDRCRTRITACEEIVRHQTHTERLRWARRPLVKPLNDGRFHVYTAVSPLLQANKANEDWWSVLVLYEYGYEYVADSLNHATSPARCQRFGYPLHYNSGRAVMTFNDSKMRSTNCTMRVWWG